MINWLYAVMTIFTQQFNICSSKFERSTAPIVPPAYAPGSSDWWPDSFVLILLLQVQTRRQLTPATKRQIWHGWLNLQPPAQCVAYWLEQGSPNYGPRINFVIDEKLIYLRKFVDLVEFYKPRNNHITWNVRPSTCSVLQKRLEILG